MKEILSPYASYNVWANQQLLSVIDELSEAQQQQEIVSSFNSLYKTTLHMWNAESIWWQRMKLQERIYVPAEQFTGNFHELSGQLQQQDRMWMDWVATTQEHVLHHVFQYQTTKKEVFKQPLYQMVLHVFNHSTYHRGQLVTMLRQLGVDKLPATDFILWSRKGGK